MKKLGVFLLVLITISGLILGCSTTTKEQFKPDNEKVSETKQEPKSDPIVLKAVSFLAVNDPLNGHINKWIELVDEATDGQVTINWIGGPEIAAPIDQFDAMQRGMVDILFTGIAFYLSQAPEIMSFPLTELTPWEERESGFYDLMVERHKKINTMYLGRWLTDNDFYVFVKEPVTKPEDLTGRKIRSVGIYDRFINELGAKPVTIMPADIYTALERGTVDGFCWNIPGPRNLGWMDTTKYIIDHGFFNQISVMLISLDKWNDIPKELQDKIMAATVEFEHFAAEYNKKLVQEEREILKNEQGVTFIKFSPEDAERYVNAAKEVEWAWIEQKVPDLVGELKSKLTK